MARNWGNGLKAVFDYALTAVGTICISPLLVYVAYRIKKDSPGQAIYDGKRLGKNGVLFKCYKFRSMYINGDAILE
ncbi:sugar transferase, partial [uncultured Phascolarctobacterium sp.]|uniref:sugar transferase n=1 Tax=uncultured Phascolarctobacterium sp. TaxID=512296 RepID=UPI0025FF9086